MRRLFAATITIALVVAGVASTVGTPAQAAPVFDLVDGTLDDPRIMIDASDDGRYVLTERLSSGAVLWSVVDTTTGSSLPIPTDLSSPHLSGDGRRLVYSTRTPIAPGDVDQLPDVYSVSLSNPQDVRWLSSDYDTYAMTAMTTDATGTLAVIHADPQPTSNAQILFGSTAGLVPLTRFSTNLRIIGITDDGSTVLFSEYDDCTPTPSCLVYRLRSFDVASGAVSQRPVVASGSAVEAFEVAMDADASCLAFVRRDVGGLWRTCDGAPAVQIASGFLQSGPYPGCPMIDLSPDGSSVAWLANADSRIGGVVRATAQPFVLGPTGTAELQSVIAPTDLPSGLTHCVRITSAGVLIETEQDDLVAGGGQGVVRVFLRRDDATTPTTTPPPTTTTPPPPTTAPPTTTTSPTAPSTSAPATTVVVPPLGSPTTTAPSVASAGPVPGASVFTGRTPVRIVDTRDGTGVPAGLPAAATRITVPLRGRFGVPADATAVAVQLTATDGTAAGYVSLVPDAGLLGRTSSLNIDEAGETIANSAVVPIGPDGSIVMYTMSPTHLVLDLAGWWTPTTAASAAGRFEPIGPARFLDTRPDSRVGHTGGKPAAGSITTIQVTGRSGVPAIGVSAVVLNVTIDAPESLGFVQAAPAATLTPGTSSTLNVGSIGKVMAASTIVPIDSEGRIAVYAQPSTHLIVDVAGYITGDGAPVALDGMFVAYDRIDRALDSRGFSGTDPRVTAGGRRQIFSAGSAVVGNLAVTSTGGPGFVQLGPNDSMVNGATSNINPTRAEETVANAFIVPTGGGAVGLYTSVDTHVIVDVSGYMTS